MTTTEQDKDEGIDEIVKMNIPPEDKVHYIADLAKHRGKCMDQDAIRIHKLELTVQEFQRQVAELLVVLHTRSPWDNFKIWLNGWARS